MGTVNLFNVKKVSFQEYRYWYNLEDNDLNNKFDYFSYELINPKLFDHPIKIKRNHFKQRVWVKLLKSLIKNYI